MCRSVNTGIWRATSFQKKKMIQSEKKPLKILLKFINKQVLNQVLAEIIPGQGVCPKMKPLKQAALPTCC